MEIRRFKIACLRLRLASSVARAVAIDADGEDFDATSTALAVWTRLLTGYNSTSQQLRAFPWQCFWTLTSWSQRYGRERHSAFYDQVRITQSVLSSLRLSVFLAPRSRCLMARRTALCQSLTLFRSGRLEEPSAIEQSALRKTQADMDVAYINAGVLTPEEVALNRFRATGWSAETTIDLEVRQKQLELDKQNGPTDNAGAGAESSQASGAPVDAPQETARNRRP